MTGAGKARSGSGCRVALVTEELSSGGCSGGIGGAYHELALALARAGHCVEILFAPAVSLAAEESRSLERFYAAHRVIVTPVDSGAFCWGPAGAEQKSYAVFRTLFEREDAPDFLHFHDYKGFGFFSLAAKRQRLAFPHTQVIVQAHGPTRWTAQANGHPFTHPDQLRIDWMERCSVAWADLLVSPSAYLLSWFASEGWTLPGETRVIQNVCSSLASLSRRRKARSDTRRRFDEILFYGRHEERKGFAPFCQALDAVAPLLAARGVKVTFLGRFGEVNGAPSVQALAHYAASWRFPLEILPDCNRDEATALIEARPGALLVVPSPVENSPYTVLEAVLLGRPVITSCEGGAGELLDPSCRAALTCQIDARALATKIRVALDEGLPEPVPAVSPTATERAWCALHRRPALKHSVNAAPRPPARVAAAIVHHERPAKLAEALLSLAAQTYENTEIVIVDDGSRTPETLACLDRLEPLVRKLGARMIRTENNYLGAARNRAAHETSSDYLLFLDDDDLAFPTLVQTLVTAAEATGAAAVNCLNLFMEEDRRSEATPFPEAFKQKVSYLPLGGPISLATSENCFGAATALIRRDAFERVGGYTELRGVGHEDYEFYVRLVQAGERIEICPHPLYLYETGRPSMISSTSRLRNFARVAAAIEPRRLPEQAVSDLMSLIAGQRAREHDFNFKAYLFKTHPQGVLLERMHEHPPHAPEYAACAAEYAMLRGAHGLAASLRVVEMRRRGCAGDNGVPYPSEPVASDHSLAHRLEPVPVRADSAVVSAFVDVAFGRLPEAAARCRPLLERRRSRALPPLLLRVLSGIAEAGPEPAIAGSLLALLRTRSDTLANSAVLLKLALAADEHEWAEEFTEQVRLRDEEAYLAAYPDVADAVSRGLFRRGYEHWAGHRAENRAGFDASEALAAIVRDHAAQFSRPALTPREDEWGWTA